MKKDSMTADSNTENHCVVATSSTKASSIVNDVLKKKLVEAAGIEPASKGCDQ